MSGDDTLIGKKVLCPGSVFNSPGAFSGVVTGTPKAKGRRASRVYVQFDNDDTEYWFPTKEVSQWLVDDGKPASGGGNAESVSPVGRKSKKRAAQLTDSEATEPAADPTSEGLTSGVSDFETSEAEPFDEEDDAEPPTLGTRASDVAVAYGAEYGIPVGLTLLVLVVAGLVYFFFQLYYSEHNLSHSSIP